MMPFANQEFLLELINATPDPMVIVNSDGRIVLSNKQLEIVFGFNSKELLGKNVEVLMPDSYRERHKLLRKQFYENPRPRPMGESRELLGRNKRGFNFPVEISLSPLNWHDIFFVLVSMRDISKRKKGEKDLNESYAAIRMLMEHLQNIREEERTEIAREIHDELGQQLTVMRLDLKWLEKNSSSQDVKVRNRMTELLVAVDNTIRCVRRISTELRPPLLDDLGIVAAIKHNLSEFEKKTGITCVVTTPENEPTMDARVKNGLFRIFQESLTNIARHSSAGKVVVVLSMKRNVLKLMIQDDGVGFDIGHISDKRTLGILGMKERARMIGGDFAIKTEPGLGCTVVVKLHL